MNRSEIVECYWRYHELSTSPSRQDRLQAAAHFNAWECVEDLAQENPHECLKTLLDLADAARSQLQLSFLGAGPLESLLDRHPTYAQAVADAARRSPGLRAALAFTADSSIPDGASGAALRQLRAHRPT